MNGFDDCDCFIHATRRPVAWGLRRAPLGPSRDLPAADRRSWPHEPAGADPPRAAGARSDPEPARRGVAARLPRHPISAPDAAALALRIRLEGDLDALVWAVAMVFRPVPADLWRGFQGD